MVLGLAKNVSLFLTLLSVGVASTNIRPKLYNRSRSVVVPKSEKRFPIGNFEVSIFSGLEETRRLDPAKIGESTTVEYTTGDGNVRVEFKLHVPKNEWIIKRKYRNKLFIIIKEKFDGQTYMARETYVVEQDDREGWTLINEHFGNSGVVVPEGPIERSAFGITTGQWSSQGHILIQNAQDEEDVPEFAFDVKRS